MGGIAKYQQAFFTTEFLQNEPAYLRFVQHLNALIIDQVSFSGRISEKLSNVDRYSYYYE